MDLQGKKVLVFGAGISGIGSCGLLEKEGAEVILYDGNDKKDAEAMKAQLGEGSKVRVVLGAFPEEEMESLDLVVMSPGVPNVKPIKRCTLLRMPKAPFSWVSFANARPEALESCRP